MQQRRGAHTFGFSKGWSTSSVIGLLREALWCSVVWGRPLVVLAADIWRCFDRLRHVWLEWAMAQERGLQAWLRRAVMREYLGLQAFAKIQGSGYGEPFPFERGAPTGRAEGPTLLNFLVQALMAPLVTEWERKGYGFKTACEVDEPAEQAVRITHVW